MRFHEKNGYDVRVEDSYGGQYDEYQDYSDGEEEDKYEEPKPSKEEKELLSLREKIKAEIRKSLAKQNPSLSGSLSSSKATQRLPEKDRFGSFFGPSSTVIAPRVMDEIRSMKETRAIASKAPISAHKHDVSSSQPIGSVHAQQPRIINQAKVKAQKLKESRDFFSSLFSDGSGPQSSTKEQFERGKLPQELAAKSKLSTPHSQRLSSDGRPGSLPSVGRPANIVLNSRPGSAPLNDRNLNRTNSYSANVVSNGRPVTKVPIGQPAGVKPNRRPVNAPSDSRPANTPSNIARANISSIKLPANVLLNSRPSGASANCRPSGSPLNGQPSKSSLNGHPAASVPSKCRPASVASKRQLSSTTSSGYLTKTPSSAHKLTQGRMASTSVVSKGKERPVSADRKFTQAGPENGSRHATYSQITSQKAPVKTLSLNKLPSKTSSESGLRKSTAISRPLSSFQDRSSDQRKVVQGSNRENIVQKHSGSVLKTQPSRLVSAHGSHDNSLRKKPSAKRRFEEDEEDEEDVDAAIGMIRSMFRYDPKRYAGSDEDDSDMEVGFDRIQMEERRSAKIAKREDDEELIRIQEEEQRERERLKKRRMMR